MEAFLGQINSIIWSSALIYLCLGTGLYFSVRTKFLQVRHFRHMLSIMREGRSSESGVSSFQALAMSLSGRMGTGNIAGVATAIAMGGPGAVFWMWMVAFLGASTAYVEATLAQIYKEKDDNGEYRGGPAYFIEKAMGQNCLASLQVEAGAARATKLHRWVWGRGTRVREREGEGNDRWIRISTHTRARAHRDFLMVSSAVQSDPIIVH